jgi:mycoredoxin
VAEKIILYGRRYCGQVYTTKKKFDEDGIDYEYIDIQQNPEARELVRQINNGNESVPTIVFPDGSTLTEPSRKELQAKLKSLS